MLCDCVAVSFECVPVLCERVEVLRECGSDIFVRGSII